MIAKPNQMSMASRVAIIRFFKLDPLATVGRYAEMEITRGNAGRARCALIALGAGRGYGGDSALKSV